MSFPEDIKKLLNKKIFQIGILIILTFTIYTNTLLNNFAWDDQDFLFNWQSIRDNGGFSAQLSLPALLIGDLPSNHLGVYRPLRSIFYVLSFKLYRLNPLGYHIQAILIHLSAGLLIYFITGLITKRKLMPFMTAVLFATHPIHTESISFITASFDTIGIVFLLISFYLYLRAQRIKERIKSHYFASYIYASFAFFTYEMTLVLPLLIVLYDYCFKKLTIKNWLLKFKTYLPYFILLAGYGVLRFLILGVGNRADYLGSSFLNSAILSRIETPEMLLQYFFWLFAPINLSIAHQVPQNLLSGLLAINNLANQGIFITDLLIKISIIIPVVTIVFSVVLMMKLFSKKKEAAFGFGWVITSLFTVFNILPQGTAWAERFLYLPSFGFSFLTAYLYSRVHSLLKKSNHRYFSSWLLIAIFISNVIGYSTITFLRNKDWKNDQTLYSSVLRINPEDYLAHNGIGLFYIRENKIDLAIKSFQKSVSIKPSNANHLNNLALAYTMKGNLALALKTYKQSISVAPDFSPTHISLANLYLKNNQKDLALEEYQTALKINPKSDTIHNLLGIYYDKEKKYDLAIKEYKAALTINPNRSKTLNNLGLAYIQIDQLDLAIQTFKLSLEVNNNNAETYFNLASAYEKKGDLNLAISEYKKGLKLDPANNTMKEKMNNLIKKEGTKN